MLFTTLLKEAGDLLPDMVALRRRLHAYPEVGLHLPKTRQMVLEALSGLPLQIYTHQTTSGVAAILEGGQPGPSIVLRGDMDGLPMPEDTGLEFASTRGTMHACGHDLHTSMLVGAARLLALHRQDLSGKVLFMFQPGEEGHFGAKFMLEEGLLEQIDPRPTRGFAIHVMSLHDTGTVHLRPGAMMAAADEIDVVITGSGGHASSPWNAVDPIPVAAEIIQAIQVAVTRRVDVFDPAVVTFAQVHGGTAYNVIPESVHLSGTVRTVSDERREQVHDMVQKIIDGVAAAHGVGATLRVKYGYPVTINDATVASDVAKLARGLLGDGAYVEMAAPIMGAEDWSYVIREIPGVMVFLGARPAELRPDGAPANHSNRVRFDEAAMAGGCALHVAVAMQHLGVPLE